MDNLQEGIHTNRASN